MNIAGRARVPAAALVAAERVGAKLRGKMHLRSTVAKTGDVAKTWERSTHVVIVWCLFFGVMTVAWLMGRIAVDRLVLAAEGAGADVADIVYVMRDGIHCRHILFDNETAQVADRGVGACPLEVEVYSH